MFVLLNAARARRRPRRDRARSRTRRLRWWQLLGGLGGALFVASQSITVATLGVALFTVCVVAGQTGNSLLVDRLGLGPGGRARITVARRRRGGAHRRRRRHRRERPLAPRATSSRCSCVLVVLAGAAAAFQQAFNGQVARVSDSAPVSSLVNFVVGSSRCC